MLVDRFSLRLALVSWYIGRWTMKGKRVIEGVSEYPMMN